MLGLLVVGLLLIAFVPEAGSRSSAYRYSVAGETAHQSFDRTSLGSTPISICSAFIFFSVNFIAEAARFCSSSLNGLTVFAPPQAGRGANKPSGLKT